MPIIEAVTSPDITEDTPDAPLSFWDAFKKITGLALPMSMSYTFSLQMVLMVYILSHLNEDENDLAATTLITTLINSIVIIGISPLFSMSMVAGREIGALQEAETEGEHSDLLEKRRDHIAAIHRNGMLLSSTLAPLMISSMVFSKPILTHLFNQDETVAELTQNFLRPYAVTMPSLMVRMCSEQTMFGFGKTKPAMLIGLTNFAMCMSLGSLLSFGYLGLPPLSNSGFLIGCIAESYLTALTFSLYIAKANSFQDFKFFEWIKPLRPYVDQLKNMLTISKSILSTNVVEMSQAIVTGVLAGLIGIEEQAAFSTTMQFALFSLLLHSAFGQSCCQEMSRELGKMHYKTVSRMGKFGLLTTLGFITPIPLALSIDPDLLMVILGQKNESIGAILQYLVPIISVSCFANAGRFNLLQQLQVLGDNNGSAFVSSFCLMLGTLASVLMGLKTDLGIHGVALGYMGGMLMAFAGLLYRWQSRIAPIAIEQHQKNKSPQRPCLPSFFQKAPDNSLTDNLLPENTNSLGS